jgi:diguanylate cyclase (GGDEF)-like protein
MDELNEQFVLRAMFDSAPFPVVLVSQDGAVTRSNKQAETLASSMSSLSDEISDSLSILELLAIPSELVLGIAAPICFEHRVNTDEISRYFRITVNPVSNPDSHRLLFVEEVTERRRFEEKLLHQASHDALTGLPNRALFHDRLTHALACARREWKSLSLLYVDLDGFKYVNDTMGHTVGDKLLKAVSGRLKGCLREVDTIARMGGDEFAILLPSVGDSQDAMVVAQRIHEAIGQGFYIDNQDCFVTACVGITIFPEDASDTETIIRNADTALHRAKKHGRNSTQIYTHSLNAAAVERVRLESSLRKAMERKEFVLFYQPIIDTQTGRIIGCEALIRWMHPEMGIVSPISFIPIAEETGQIVEIGEWVVQEACKQNAKWHAMGYPVDVAVNMSARSFRNNDVIEMTRTACIEAELDPMFIHFELTETALMESPDKVALILMELKKMGIRVSIDDFGTGYSSLSNLKRFPIDSVKIDRSFVRHVTRNPDDAAIAEAIIAMAHSLKLTVVAEGVDTHDQLAFLKSHECDALQGYLISTPVSAEQFTRLLDLDSRQSILPQASNSTIESILQKNNP